MAESQMSVVWQDGAGQQTVRTIHTNTGASGILTTLQGHSNAVPATSWEGTVVSSGSSPGTAAYVSASQVAVLTFADGTGRTALVVIPAPLASIFLADGVSVDPTQIADVIAACVGTLLTQALTPVTVFQSGSLQPGKVN